MTPLAYIAVGVVGVVLAVLGWAWAAGGAKRTDRHIEAWRSGAYAEPRDRDGDGGTG